MNIKNLTVSLGENNVISNKTVFTEIDKIFLGSHGFPSIFILRLSVNGHSRRMMQHNMVSLINVYYNISVRIW